MLITDLFKVKASYKCSCTALKCWGKMISMYGPLSSFYSHHNTVFAFPKSSCFLVSLLVCSLQRHFLLKREFDISSGGEFSRSNQIFEGHKFESSIRSYSRCLSEVKQKEISHALCSACSA